MIPPNASEASAEPRKSSLRLGPVHGRECRHVCRLRRARRGLLPSRRPPSGSARLHADPAGAASLPITALILVLSPRAPPARIGPRLPLTLGPSLIAVGMVMMRPRVRQRRLLGSARAATVNAASPPGAEPVGDTPWCGVPKAKRGDQLIRMFGSSAACRRRPGRQGRGPSTALTTPAAYPGTI